MGVLEWSPTTADDIASLVRLGTACLERDGGLPDLADPQHLSDGYLTDLSICGRDELGDIVAAAAIGGGRAAENM